MLVILLTIFLGSVSQAHPDTSAPNVKLQKLREASFWKQAKYRNSQTNFLAYDANAIMQTLVGPYDDGKKTLLRRYGFTNMRLIKNKDRAMISEKYWTSNGSNSATVSRNPDTGNIDSIALHIKGRQKWVIDKWYLAQNSVTHMSSDGRTTSSLMASENMCHSPQHSATEQDKFLKRICPLLLTANQNSSNAQSTEDGRLPAAEKTASPQPPIKAP